MENRTIQELFSRKSVRVFSDEKITEEEKKTAENIVRANAANFDGRVKKISFKKRAEDFGGDIVC